MSHHKDARNPRGLATRKPISLRLMPNELLDAERIAKELGVTKSRIARDAFIAGLPLISSGVSSAATPPAAASTGGEDSPSPAGLSLAA